MLHGLVVYLSLWVMVTYTVDEFKIRIKKMGLPFFRLINAPWVLS